MIVFVEFGYGSEAMLVNLDKIFAVRHVDARHVSIDMGPGKYSPTIQMSFEDAKKALGNPKYTFRETR